MGVAFYTYIKQERAYTNTCTVKLFKTKYMVLCELIIAFADGFSR